ncbi:ventricular zone-expressed PH domain-containing protein [Trichomycterus rosablanca]|uniref:ventricular zone-expressed PH domain-containing protein n=1 Tax=Trichomycterus rosablanca TaxID=2290929 RepID=UPI002F35A864
MHQLFRLVLGQRDLSRAGDLFSLDDGEIEDSLSQALEEIRNISCSPDYLTNDNDQAVVEICITRITTAIRETRSIERHGAALVALWESCLEHNLQPQGKDEDTPHAKIASDITSCILQNYNRAPVMALAVPVAVRFLQRGNRELSRNMSSYLSLAAIAKAELLAQHTQAITLSVLGGNGMLLRVLPSIYPLAPDPIHQQIQRLVSMIPDLDPTSRQHLLRLLQMISELHPLTLAPVVPSLTAHLSDASLNEVLLSSLVDVAQVSPASLHPFLHTLRTVGQQTQGLLGHVAKIHGAVGLTSEDNAREALLYLASLLACTEHSVHHTLLQEIRTLTERYTTILGEGAKDVYRTSNSFSVVARLLGHRLQADSSTPCRTNQKLEESKPCEETGPTNHTTDQHLHQDSCHRGVSHQNPAPHVQRSRCSDPDRIEDGDEPGLAPCPDGVEHTGDFGDIRDLREDDRLWKHLRDNMERIRVFCFDMVKRIPVPEQCVIEDTQQGCVAKLFFSCPLKGHFCLFGKSSFSLCSRQPHIWIRIMLLALQSRTSCALSCGDVCVQQLRRLWEQIQLKGAHSFELAMTQTAVPYQKELDGVQIHLEEVRFFDLFSYSQDEGGWLCFMCSNPEKATVVNQDGQPLIEGLLKEKQVRWRFIKRWKTRYFTLAGNQLLFRKGKSNDEPDATTIELSKVQSVKAVARKKRERGLPRAFEIFTESKTYVLKAPDEKHAEEWLQYISVAVAQARERENREATTYL